MSHPFFSRLSSLAQILSTQSPTKTLFAADLPEQCGSCSHRILFAPYQRADERFSSEQTYDGLYIGFCPARRLPSCSLTAGCVSGSKTGREDWKLVWELRPSVSTRKDCYRTWNALEKKVKWRDIKVQFEEHFFIIPSQNEWGGLHNQHIETVNHIMSIADV